MILLWWAVASLGIWNRTLFPSPLEVAQSLWYMVQDGSLFIATAVSLKRVIIGFGISLAVGIPLGIVLARVKWMENTFGSLVTGFQALPSICWLPLALLWFGLNDNAILFVIIMGSLMTVAIAVSDGVKNIPPLYVRAALTMGTRPLPLYAEVLLPASLPTLITGAKLGWAYAWRALMSGELLFVSLGLGHLLMMGRDLADMGQVMGIMLVIIVLGLLVDRCIFAVIEARVRERWGLTTA